MKPSLLKALTILGIACMATSCTTYYDQYGRPIQVVTPEGAAAAALAAGVVGYAIANNRRDNYYRGNNGYRPSNYHRGGSCRY